MLLLFNAFLASIGSFVNLHISKLFSHGNTSNLLGDFCRLSSDSLASSPAQGVFRGKLIPLTFHKDLI